MSPVTIRAIANDKLIGFNIRGDKYEQDQRKKARLTRITSPPENLPLPELPSRSHALYDSILKLRVANEKLEELASDIRGFITSKLNSIRFEDEPGCTHKLIRLVVGKRPNPNWDVEIGGLAVLLRSVLDISVTRLSRRRPGRPKKPQFPIFVYRTNKARQVSTFARNRTKLIGHLRPDEQAIIERAQPYHAGNLRWRHPLWILHELSNADKHNALTEASMSIASSTFLFPAIPFCYNSGMQLRAGVPFEDGAILGRVGREVNVKPHHAVSIRFVKGCPATGDETIDTLTSIEKQVRKIVTDFLVLHPPR